MSFIEIDMPFIPPDTPAVIDSVGQPRPGETEFEIRLRVYRGGSVVYLTVRVLRAQVIARPVPDE